MSKRAISEIKRIEARVIIGSGRGKKIGIPTFNFALTEDLTLDYGIYAGFLLVSEKKYPTVIHFGPRPTFDEKEASLEVHVISKSFPQQSFEKAQIVFTAYIRQIIDFDSAESMVKEIKKDIKKAKSLLSILTQ